MRYPQRIGRLSVPGRKVRLATAAMLVATTVAACGGGGQDGVDHLERHDLRQLAQMARGEDTVGYRDLAGDDTLTGQRSSHVVTTRLGGQAVLPGLRFLRPADHQIGTHPLPPGHQP